MTDIQSPVVASAHSLTRQLGRGVLISLAVLVAMTLLVVLLNAVFLRLFDNLQQWQEWRSNHYWHLLAWRLVLYITLAVAWLKLKARLPESERQRLRMRVLRVEILVVLLVLLIELSKVLLQPGGVL